jgi:hypothetical protein
VPQGANLMVVCFRQRGVPRFPRLNLRRGEVDAEAAFGGKDYSIRQSFLGFFQSDDAS